MRGGKQLVMKTKVPSRFSHGQRIFFLSIGIFFAILFIVFSYWVSRQATKGVSMNFPSLESPGQYACDPFGTCNLYEDTASKGCPQTFADSTCLGRCGEDKSIWCPN